MALPTWTPGPPTGGTQAGVVPRGVPQGSSSKTLTIKAKAKPKGKPAAKPAAKPKGAPHKPEFTPTQLHPSEILPKHGPAAPVQAPNELGLTPAQIKALGPEGKAAVAAAIAKYGGALKGVGDQIGTATAHGHALDPLYQAFNNELGRIKGEQAAHVAAAQGAVAQGDASAHQLEGSQQAQILAALAGRAGGGDIGSQLAAQVGGQAAAGAVGLDRLAAINSGLIAQQGQASADMLGRIGAIAQGAKAQHAVENQNTVNKLLGDRTELMKEGGAYATADAADRGAAKEKNLIAAAAVDQRNRDSLRNFLLGKQKLTTAQQIAQGHDTTQAGIAGTKADQAAAELAAKVKHWSRQDDAALIRANKTGTGKGASGKSVTVHRADGTAVQLTHAEVAKWNSLKSKINGAAGGVAAIKATVSDSNKAIQLLHTRYGISPAVAQAVWNMQTAGALTVSDYRTLASMFPGGIVPKGYWIHASPADQAKMHGG